ncbi:hypothetical protein M9C84_06430 [SAR86 cluster bacterium]|jgi:hypothetical protein|nr:hypothetical protein M9C84_06430 [SAR86 cluster bacterium]
MKKLLLITLLFLITPYAKANMDNICFIFYRINMSVQIEKNCERNNILQIYDVPKDRLITTISLYCRQDREINYLLHTSRPVYRLSCVLYDNKPRKRIDIINDV